MHAQIERFYANPELRQKVAATERLTELVLAPLGGPWRRGELIAFGTDPRVSNLQAKGRRLFNKLFGKAYAQATAGES